MRQILHAGDVPEDIKQSLIDLLLALADDEFILGYWDSEWTGVAPVLEEDVACSSIAQDEIGHARLLYQEVAQLSGMTLDQIAYGRETSQYRHAQLVEHPRGDWAFTIARQYLYETADQLRVASLLNSGYLPLAQAMTKIQREEVYHAMHVQAWLSRLATGTAEARQRLEAALERLWSDVPGMFEPFAGEQALLQYEVLTQASEQLQHDWYTQIAPIFAQLQLTIPSEAIIKEQSIANAGTHSGRNGQHTQDFQSLWEQMTMVYRMDPQASW